MTKDTPLILPFVLLTLNIFIQKEAVTFLYVKQADNSHLVTYFLN